MGKEILLVWKGRNEKLNGNFIDTKESTIIYIDTQPLMVKMEKDIESYKNRIRVLEKLNSKYREKLCLSNEHIEIPKEINECTHKNMQMKSSGIWKCKCGYSHF